MAKPIYFSTHAREQMLLRGAEEDEVIAAIRSGNWQPAKNGKFSARAEFDYHRKSPVNQQFYSSKAVQPIFNEQPGRIIVVTVKVYYFN
ncbi:MAG: DUF4258 domain-containing protein [Oscillatoria princeps RMCB-10]|jgi:hypothetical protein|nr:DUF4258 domain-containing protein [Oscillatoria princeps RMCB-10]